MSEEIEAKTQKEFAASADWPAVGIITSESTADVDSRAMLRADMQGYDLFVTHRGDPSLEVLDLAEHLGATVIHPRRSDPSNNNLRRELAAAAQAKSYPGILHRPITNARIDYERSRENLRDADGFGTEAVVERSESDTRLFVGIPAYNEAQSIASVVSDATAYADAVLVVDDGSDDDTAKVAGEAGADVIEHDQNQGYGAALKTLFRTANKREADQLVILDADGQHEPSDIPALSDRHAESDAQIVIGSRFVDGGKTNTPLYRRAGISVVNILTNISLGIFRPSSWIQDTQSGFRCYGREAIKTLSDNESIGSHMGASTDVIHHAYSNDYDIDEVGVHVRYDVEDANSHHPIEHGLTLIGNILRTIETKHPIASIGVPGFLSILVGLFFGYRTAILYSKTNIFPPGHGITAVFFLLMGVFACFTAIILHSTTRVVDQT